MANDTEVVSARQLFILGLEYPPKIATNTICQCFLAIVNRSSVDASVVMELSLNILGLQSRIVDGFAVNPG